MKTIPRAAAIESRQISLLDHRIVDDAMFVLPGIAHVAG
jgi:hypothetical protein